MGNPQPSPKLISSVLLLGGCNGDVYRYGCSSSTKWWWVDRILSA